MSDCGMESVQSMSSCAGAGEGSLTLRVCDAVCTADHRVIKRIAYRVLRIALCDFGVVGDGARVVSLPRDGCAPGPPLTGARLSCAFVGGGKSAVTKSSGLTCTSLEVSGGTAPLRATSAEQSFLIKVSRLGSKYVTCSLTFSVIISCSSCRGRQDVEYQAHDQPQFTKRTSLVHPSESCSGPR